MAKPKSPLLSLGASGTIADTLTFQKRGRGHIVRQKPIPKDPRTEAQLAQRQIYRDAVATWHALTQEEKEAWRGVCPGLTAYQCFMRSALVYVPPVPPPEEQTEEQTEYDIELTLRVDFTKRGGQRLTIAGREVTKLGFWLYKLGLPTGDITFIIRKVSDDGILLSKVLMDASELTLEATYYEVEFDTPLVINEEVRILAEVAGGDTDNRVFLMYQNADVKADEYLTQYYNEAYHAMEWGDAAYRYKYYLP